MARSAEEILIEYNLHKINGWAVMSWAAEQDPSAVLDSEALSSLVHLDDMHTGRGEEVVLDALKKLVSKDGDKSSGEVVVEAAISMLESEKINSDAFMNIFLDFYYNEVDNDVDCSDWI